MMAPTHFFDTEIGGSAHGVSRSGLTPLGREWVARMEAKKMVIDLAHASPATLDDVLKIATRPVVVSHTGVRGTCDNERNLSDAQLRGIYASGIRRVLQKNRPRREQPYQTMQLIQWNWFMEHGVLRFENGRLRIDYRRYPAAVTSLLRETLAIQRAGDRARANAFVEQWTTWRPDLHEVIATRMRNSERTRFSLVTYEALSQAQ